MINEKKKFGGSSGIRTHEEESEQAIGVQGATIALQTMLLVSKNASIIKDQRQKVRSFKWDSNPRRGI